jgi:hypothetical protein
MEQISTTRIQDLPEHGLPVNNGNASSQFADSTGYKPINVHPNPYGINVQSPGVMPNPKQDTNYTLPQTSQIQYPPQLVVSQGQAQAPMYIPQGDLQQPQYKLPSRDVVVDSSQYIQDEQIKANYIPEAPSKSINDYVKDYEKELIDKNKKYQESKQREETASSWFDEFQYPILIAVLFFSFHLPIVNTMIFKRFDFLSIYNPDGNFNSAGLLLKSLLFGTTYYLIDKFVKYISV